MATDSLGADCRAVEGMPIRLVVAVAVGAAALGLLIPLAETVEHRDSPEVTVELEPRQFALGPDTVRSVQIAVLTESGRPVEDAAVVVSGRSLPVNDGPVVLRTGPESNTIEAEIGTRTSADVRVSFRPAQTRGTLEIDVVPPPGYEDERNNPEITVRQP